MQMLLKKLIHNVTKLFNFDPEAVLLEIIRVFNVH